MGLGAAWGWFVAEFHPAFPLAIVMVIFCLYDAYTAYKLDKRAHVYYPDATKRHEAKFASFKLNKVIQETIPKRLMLIFLAYLVEHWVCIHVQIPLSYVVTGAICFEQAWSILENEASCRPDNDSRLFRFLKRIMIDKTARHFDDDFREFTEPTKKEENEKDK
jgi:hypothetical protein